jgi:7-keto-8-aminopelargonate synthetase-like enzyme
LIDFLVNRARSFIFSTAPVPAAAAAATAGIRFIQSKAGEARCEALWQLVHQFITLHATRLTNPPSAILPLIIGNETKAVEAAARLRAQGIFVPAIRFPTVARGQARLRVTLTASHTADEISVLARALDHFVNRQS